MHGFEQIRLPPTKKKDNGATRNQNGKQFGLLGMAGPEL